jgi:hypothetical protein
MVPAFLPLLKVPLELTILGDRRFTRIMNLVDILETAPA